MGVPLRFETSAVWASHMGSKVAQKINKLRTVCNIFCPSVYFSGEGPPEFLSRALMLCRTLPSLLLGFFIIVCHMMLYDAVIKNKDLDPSISALIWRD